MCALLLVGALLTVRFCLSASVCPLLFVRLFVGVCSSVCVFLLVGVLLRSYIGGTAAQSVYSSSHFCERIRKKPWKARGKPEETEKPVESPRKARGNQKTASTHFNSVVFVCPLFFRFLPFFLPSFLPSFFRFSRPFSRPFSRLFF